MSDLAIDIRNVVKRYDQHVAVRDLSLQVPRGSVYGLLGPNGAGKTTTIRMILDIILPDAGSISIFGRPNTEAGILNKVGYLPEERGLYKKMQVRRVLLFLAELKGIRPVDASRRIDEWLERFSLVGDRNWGDARVDELSRGMQLAVPYIIDDHPRIPGEHEGESVAHVGVVDPVIGRYGHRGPKLDGAG